MPLPFTRSLRSLHADHPRAWLRWIFVSAALGFVWTLWFTLAPLTVRLSSSTARVESLAAPVQSPLEGKVARVLFELGRPVRSDEILIELDAQDIWLKLEEEEARRDAAEQRLRSAEARQSEEQARLTAEAEAETQAERVGRSRVEVAEVAAQQAQQVHASALRLVNSGGISAAQVQAEGATAASLTATAAAARQELALLQDQHRANAAARDSRRRALTDELTSLQEAFSTAETRVAALEEQVERHRIRALVDGTVSLVRPLTLGQRVATGELLATVVPTEDLQVVAWLPLVAAGRVQEGQSARMYLDGFSWLRYGALPLRVRSVASEPGPEGLRVELELEESPLPLGHGLPGRVEIAVEQSTPLGLVLDVVGLHIGGGA